MNSKIIKMVMAGAILALSGLANAALVTVNFEVILDNDGSSYGGGSFVGIDIDEDGFIETGELTAFSFLYPSSFNAVGSQATLANLSYISDYQISPANWTTPTATNTGWFQWAVDTSGFRISPTSFSVETDDVSVSVPEPSTFAILALGIIGLGSRKFMKHS